MHRFLVAGGSEALLVTTGAHAAAPATMQLPLAEEILRHFGQIIAAVGLPVVALPAVRAVGGHGQTRLMKKQKMGCQGGVAGSSASETGRGGG